MGKLILVIGEPGTGKSRAIIGLDPSRTILVTPNKKDLPFRGASSAYNEKNNNRFVVKEFIQLRDILVGVNGGSKITTIVVEDLTHFISHKIMEDAKKKGYEKWMDLAMEVFGSLIDIEDSLRDDLYVIVTAHTTTSSDVQGNQIITLQTAGKLLENNIKIPSYFTYILHTNVNMENNKPSYTFLTNTDGVRLAKSPEDCLSLYEPNDYKLIIDKIESYQKGEKV